VLPSIPVANFMNPAPRSREYKAVNRALELKPNVHPIGEYEGEKYFRVSGRDNARYVVVIWLDPGSQEPVAQCSCEAFYVPQEPTPCFHLAACLLHEAAEANQ